MPAASPIRYGDWMQTFTGVQFWPLDPRVDEIHIEDIAHALSNQCRYGGHCKSFYSVAQHSVLVSHHVPPQDALWGLLHDASEAYLVDLPRPVKHHSELGQVYIDIESRLMQVIAARFSLPWPEPSSIREVDNRALITERRDLMSHSPAPWREEQYYEAFKETIIPQSPQLAKSSFLIRFGELYTAK